MHDHRLDGMLVAAGGFTPRDLRLHLDNSHDENTSGWYFSDQIKLHAKLHAEEAERLADIEAAANLLADRLAEAPADVVEAVVSEDGRGPEQADVDALRDLFDLMADFPDNDQRARYLLSSNWMRDRGDIASRHARRAPVPVLDLMDRLENSIAARATLGQESSGA